MLFLFPSPILWSSDVAKGAKDEAQEQAVARKGICMLESARRLPGRGGEI